YGIEISTLNILNAIDWVAEAWKNIMENIIYRCWERTNILPDKLDINNELLDSNIEVEDKIIQSFINQIIVDNSTIVKAKDYIEIDNNLETGNMLNNDEIITAVQEAPEYEDE
ncbi:9715_t:CDS:1, partial [Acaulospora morrowiae]